MKSYTIFVEPGTGLAPSVVRRVGSALGDDISMMSNECNLDTTKVEISLFPARKSASAPKKFEIIANYTMARGISEIIVKDMLLPVIRRILRDIDFLCETEKNRAVFIAVEQIYSKTARFAEWQAVCCDRLFAYFSENKEITLEGFLMFRMKEMYNEWKRTARLAAEEVVIEREFAEFINLLRCMVDMQKPGLAEVHVVPMDDGYILLDSQMHELKPIEGVLEGKLAQEMNRDDLLISALVNIAPMKITVHGEKTVENSMIMHTIDKVFPGKVIFERTESPN